MSVWYEICVEQNGAIRDVQVRGNREGASRMVETLTTQWPEADMIFVRQHSKGTFKVLHKLTVKRDGFKTYCDKLQERLK